MEKIFKEGKCRIYWIILQQSQKDGRNPTSKQQMKEAPSISPESDVIMVRQTIVASK